jgi:hypothetical protein
MTSEGSLSDVFWKKKPSIHRLIIISIDWNLGIPQFQTHSEVDVHLQLLNRFLSGLDQQNRPWKCSFSPGQLGASAENIGQHHDVVVIGQGTGICPPMLNNSSMSKYWPEKVNSVNSWRWFAAQRTQGVPYTKKIWKFQVSNHEYRHKSSVSGILLMSFLLPTIHNLLTSSPRIHGKWNHCGQDAPQATALAVHCFPTTIAQDSARMRHKVPEY